MHRKRITASGGTVAGVRASEVRVSLPTKTGSKCPPCRASNPRPLPLVSPRNPKRQGATPLTGSLASTPSGSEWGHHPHQWAAGVDRERGWKRVWVTGGISILKKEGRGGR